MRPSKKVRRQLVERKIIQNLVLKKTFNEISRELKVCKKTIRKIFIKAKEAGYLDGKELPAFPENHFFEEEIILPTSGPDTLMGPHIDWIRERKASGWHWVTIWEELPIKVSRASFFRFIKRHGLDREGDYGRLRVVPEIIHAPAEALILDWGKLCDFVDATGKKKTAWAFIGVMGFSRWMSVRIVLTNSTEETISALENILQELGGVPQRVTSDNPKCFAIEASRYEPLLNVAFERFASHYGFVMECLPPADPQKKGKVERLVPFVRRLFEAHGEWTTLKEAQDYLNKKIEIANQRKHGTTRLCPIDQFNTIESSALKELPPLAFEKEEYHTTTVRKDGHIRFRGKYYSLEEAHIGKKVFVIGTYERVSIYLENKLIESHARLYSGNTSKSTKTHHRKFAEQIMGDNDLYLKRAEKIGPCTKEVVRRILLSGNGFVDTRKIWGILGLDKEHSSEAIEAACEYVLDQNDLSYRSILGFLQVRKKEPVTKALQQQTHRFIRDVDEYLGQLNLPMNKEKKLCQ